MSAALDAEDIAVRRLHPWSWLFVLLQHLKQFLLPLLVLAVFGGRDGRNDHIDQLVMLAVGSALIAVSLLRYLTYHYRIGRDSLSIRSGWLQRSLREIPFARIHNVVVHQSLLHRLFGVAEVRLESAGGAKPEAEMRVLRLDQALALERQIRHRAQADPASADAASASDVLLALPTSEVLRQGLISNRGMVVVAAAFGATYQLFPERMVSNAIEHYGRQLFGYASHLHLGWMAGVVTLALMLATLLLIMRVLSMALALLQYHGFRLSESERRLTVERGLLARLRTSVARRRIQAWTLHEGVLHRLLRRRSLHIDTAVMDGHGEQGRALKELAPLATPAACDALLHRLLPQIAWPPPQWHAIATRCWWRLCLPAACLVPLACAALWRPFGAWAALSLLWLPWSAFKAWRQAQRMGYAVDARYVAVRGGWWTRWWRLAEIDKLQALQLTRSPLDRCCGTATLWLDTAGARHGEPPLRVRLVPETEAQALYLQLSRALARRRLRW
ncbi:PH domain-containing protein [Xanthomonas sp. NCPPB 2654]|uniref:PH domain-containing protein n=1 Tax=unclassified Xanthomonas TaxID=2643310 RepID=UPI0021DFDF92|nr:MULTISPECIES: PH domain-containing protein [unclassified Xanthomonas]MDL5367918.1 PH domain-containing protein [Xanthomonas sp. NCPPB 2654]UYC20215.1 PH domain-containing protein [Xanthomonas sp. CFBP 8443]